MENTIEKIKKFIETEVELKHTSRKYADRLIWYIDNYLKDELTAPKLVLPSEDEISIHPSYDEAKRHAQTSIGDRITGFIYGWKAHRSELLRLNPHITE